MIFCTADNAVVSVNSFFKNINAIILLRNICISFIIKIALCHEANFGTKVISYNFFATGHDKSVYDGDTIERQVKRHCIQTSPEAQITNPLGIYGYVFHEHNI